jgi:hypothetical protein
MQARKRKLAAVAAMLFVMLGFASSLGSSEGGEPLVLPGGVGSWSLPSGIHSDPAPMHEGVLEIRGVGTFRYAPAEIRSLRPDLFATGRFSAFDALAQVAARGEIALTYAYSEEQSTYVIESINGLDGWWYDVRLPGGALERTALRMDSYPMKDGAAVYLYLEDPARLAALQASFRDEVARRTSQSGQVVVPTVTIKGPRSSVTFRDVVVTSHNVRPDVFQPGAVTALDVLLSLGEQGRIDGLDLTWHAMLGDVVVNHYMVDWISLPEMLGEMDALCGYMDEAATEGLRSFLTPHSHATTKVHLSSDLELLVAPEYVEWQWLCATS